MKIRVLTLLLLLPAFAYSAEDCAKNADACAASAKSASPFLQAAAAEPAPAPQPKKVSRRRVPALVPAAASTAPAAVEVSSGALPAPAEKGAASSPLWLILVASGLLGLYAYLNGGRRRGRRK
ncbi:MAG: hypothetical protein A2X31_12410 [Elusimicrobia bacterium GWB2_63_22]|nr:MAG: hypothetical protein A2X31_12410 [Elusimicrobia bacterium GWB2_63_22]